MYVLGIDGGGTTTTAVITNVDGTVFAQALVGSSNLNSVSKSLVKQELTVLFEKLAAQNQAVFDQVEHVFAGMAGVRDEATKREISQLLLELLEKDLVVKVDTDAITALYSGTLGEAGIVQIAGTGAITYGENELGKRGRVGGWGHLFSDYGSGYSIGRDGLNAAFMEFDGVKGPTLITKLLLSHFEVVELSEIIKRIYRHDNPKKIIASLSKLVVQAAEANDQVALEIIDENGRQLGESIATLIKRLFGENYSGSVPVVLTGGIFNIYELISAPMMEEISPDIAIKVILPKVAPVCGAVIAAYKYEQVRLKESFIEQFRKTSKTF